MMKPKLTRRTFLKGISAAFAFIQIPFLGAIKPPVPDNVFKEEDLIKLLDEMEPYRTGEPSAKWRKLNMGVHSRISNNIGHLESFAINEK